MIGFTWVYQSLLPHVKHAPETRNNGLDDLHKYRTIQWGCLIGEWGCIMLYSCAQPNHKQFPIEVYYWVYTGIPLVDDVT